MFLILLIVNLVAGFEGPEYGGLVHHPGVDPQGMAFHQGPSLHAGDSGYAGVILTRDVLHHNGKGIFVSQKGTTPLEIAEGMNIDDLHNKIADDQDMAHKASLARKRAEQRQQELEASIAAEEEQQKKEEVERLKNIDLEIAKKEHVKPEALGKQVIPITTFTQESIPLIHHFRAVMARINAIRAAEQESIDSQRQVARLDDITAELPLTNPIIQNPEFYTNFLGASAFAGGPPPKVPVFGTGGDFYISKNMELNSDGGINHMSEPMGGEKQSADGHSHFIDHGPIDGGFY